MAMTGDREAIRDYEEVRSRLETALREEADKDRIAELTERCQQIRNHAGLEIEKKDYSMPERDDDRMKYAMDMMTGNRTR